MRARSLVLLAIFGLLYCLTASTQSKSGSGSGGFTTENIDASVKPCEDFYQFACGNWLKTAQIPADQSEWASFVELYERNLSTLRGILEKASANSPSRSAIDQKIGDFYAACVDEKSVDARGAAPLKPELDRIAAVKDRAGLMDAIARVQIIGPNPLFNFYTASDLHNADMVIAQI